MVLLIAEGSSFSFHLLSFSKPDAYRALRHGWKVHCEQTGCTTPLDALTINVIEHMDSNVLYRDYQPVKR